MNEILNNKLVLILEKMVKEKLFEIYPEYIFNLEEELNEMNRSIKNVHHYEFLAKSVSSSSLGIILELGGIFAILEDSTKITITTDSTIVTYLYRVTDNDVTQYLNSMPITEISKLINTIISGGELAQRLLDNKNGYYMVPVGATKVISKDKLKELVLTSTNNILSGNNTSSSLMEKIIEVLQKQSPEVFDANGEVSTDIYLTFNTPISEISNKEVFFTIRTKHLVAVISNIQAKYYNSSSSSFVDLPPINLTYPLSLDNSIEIIDFEDSLKEFTTNFISDIKKYLSNPINNTYINEFGNGKRITFKSPSKTLLGLYGNEEDNFRYTQRLDVVLQHKNFRKNIEKYSGLGNPLEDTLSVIFINNNGERIGIEMGGNGIKFSESYFRELKKKPEFSKLSTPFIYKRDNEALGKLAVGLERLNKILDNKSLTNGIMSAFDGRRTKGFEHVKPYTRKTVPNKPNENKPTENKTIEKNKIVPKNKSSKEKPKNKPTVMSDKRITREGNTFIINHDIEK